MKSKLFVESDTCLEFSSGSKAIIFAAKKGMTSFIILTFYPDSDIVKVFNPMLVNNPVEYLENEATALKYVGSFLN